jgi:carbon storage regulator
MLVLTRKQNEKIRIGPSITITVLRMKGKAVRLGIEAPQDVSVIRGELCFELGEEDGQEKHVPRRGKSVATAPHGDLASEATAHWPLPKHEARSLAAAGCGMTTGTSPLKAMLDARHV